MHKKDLTKIQQPLVISLKGLSKLGIEGNFLSQTKDMINFFKKQQQQNTPAANILNGWWKNEF